MQLIYVHWHMKSQNNWIAPAHKVTERIRMWFGISGPVRPHQDIDVIADLDVQIPCSRPETPALYPRTLLSNHEGCERDDVRDEFRDGNEGFKDPGRRGHRRSEEPWT